jgi:hypothetical protein
MRHFLGSLLASPWRRSFLRHLRREVRSLRPDADALLRRIEQSARRAFVERRGDAPDPQGLMVIGSSTMILAGYRELVAAGVDREVAYESVRRAFLATFRRSTALATRSLFALSRDPVKSLSRVSLAKFFHGLFGAMFEFEDRISTDRVDLVVTRCEFHRFFVDEGEPLLTRILCEWDHNWLDALNASGRPLRAGRFSTFSTGAQRCEFCFSRTEDPALARDVVLERRPDVAEALSGSRLRS